MTESAFRPQGMDALAGIFDAVYRGESPFGERPPWDIGGPQPAFVAAEKDGLIHGSVLDAGCGTGEDLLFLAAQGYRVTGLDLAPTAVAIARRKAAERGLDATFEVGNALELPGYDQQFDTVIDTGLAHSFGPDDLRAYAAALHRATRPGAIVHILEMSEQGVAELQLRLHEAVEQIPAELPEGAPARSPDDMRRGFAEGWTVEHIGDATIRAIAPGAAEPFDTLAWLGRFRRAGGAV